MPGYPNLFPSGFIEQEKDSCSGPILYRSQPSRETPGITELNQVIEKYAVNQTNGGDFMRLANNIKDTSRMWEKLPQFAKDDLTKLILESNGKMADDIIKTQISNKSVKFNDRIEYFGENEEIDKTDYKISETPTGTMTGNYSNKMSILVIIVVAIVAIVIGFLISGIHS